MNPSVQELSQCFCFLVILGRARRQLVEPLMPSEDRKTLAVSRVSRAWEGGGVVEHDSTELGLIETSFKQAPQRPARLRRIKREVLLHCMMQFGSGPSGKSGVGIVDHVDPSLASQTNSCFSIAFKKVQGSVGKARRGHRMR